MKPAASTPLYRVALCTTNLGANANHAGHPSLKHCFAKVIDANGQALTSLSFGLHGVASESYAEVNSANCQLMPQLLDQTQLQHFIDAFKQQGAQPYQWGHNDCCSLLSHAVKTGLGFAPPRHIALAENGIRRSRDLSGKR